jgi:hypothetical protein
VLRGAGSKELIELGAPKISSALKINIVDALAGKQIWPSWMDTNDAS